MRHFLSVFCILESTTLCTPTYVRLLAAATTVAENCEKLEHKVFGTLQCLNRAETFDSDRPQSHEVVFFQIIQGSAPYLQWLGEVLKNPDNEKNS